MDQRCGTCKFRGEPLTWCDDEEYVEKPTRYRVCERLKHLQEHPCNGEEDIRFSTEIAGVMDGSSYKASAVVTDEFGCVLWEPKG